MLLTTATVRNASSIIRVGARRKKNFPSTHCCAAFHTSPQQRNVPSYNRSTAFLGQPSTIGVRIHSPQFVFYRCKSDSLPTNETPVSTPSTTPATGYIPEPPTVDVSNAVEQLNALGEPTLSSLGLCSYYPPGWVQSLLEYIHVTFDIPWWGAIASFAVGLRLCIIPLQVYTLKAGITQQNLLPRYMELNEELQRAVGKSDQVAAMVAKMKVDKYQKKHDVRPMKSFYSAAYQAPIFISVMAAIRGMAYLPVESMTRGGMYWFSDLTIADPYFLLPLSTAATLLLSIELGSEGLRTKTMSRNTKWGIRAVIGVGVPALMAFNPAALGVYWFASNIMAVSIGAVLRTSSVKKMLNIPTPVDPPSTTFKKPVKENVYRKLKRISQEKRIQSLVDSQESINAKAFDDASRAKIVKTFKYDPTKKRAVS